MTASSGPRPVGGEAGSTTEAAADGTRRGGDAPFGNLVPRAMRLAWLTLVWILLWGTFSWANLLGGLAVALLVLLVFPLPGISGGGRLRPLGVVKVVGRIGIDLVVSSAQVAWQSIRPGPPLGSSVVEVRFEERSELLMAALIEALSLVPGSVVVEADAERGILWSHVLGAVTDEDVEAFRRQVRALEKDLLATGIAAVRVEREAGTVPAADETEEQR